MLLSSVPSSRIPRRAVAEHLLTDINASDESCATVRVFDHAFDGEQNGFTEQISFSRCSLTVVCKRLFGFGNFNILQNDAQFAARRKDFDNGGFAVNDFQNFAGQTALRKSRQSRKPEQ